MKTTLMIDDGVMSQIRERAARDRCTLSEVVEAALRSYLQPAGLARDLPPLPVWSLGPFRVDVSDRRALYDLLDPDRPAARQGEPIVAESGARTPPGARVTSRAGRRRR